MARYSAGGLTGAGSTTLPIISIVGGSVPKQGRVREIGITNTTSTAFAVKLVRLTTMGTAGANIVEDMYDPGGSSPNCTVWNTHTVNPTLGNDMGYRASIGAAVGAGVIWTFGENGLATGSTPNGIGVIVENGTGQAAQAYVVWDE